MTTRDAPDEEPADMLRRYLEKKYAVRIRKVQRLDRGVFSVENEGLKNGGERWIARVFPKDRALERARGDAEVLRFLEKHGFAAERCITTGESLSFTAGRAILLTEYVNGAQLRNPDETILRKMGESIGRLHSLPNGDGVVSREAGALHHYTRQEGGVRNELEAAAVWLDSVKDSVPAGDQGPYNSLLSQLASADALGGLPEVLIHPDPVPKNALVRDGEVVWIDWTGAGSGPRVHSVAILTWAGALNDGGWSRSRVEAVIDGYRSRVKLRKEEVARLASAMSIRPLVFGCWRYYHAFRAGKIPDGSEWWMPDPRLVDEIAAYASTLLLET